jgi:hypothetical protein
MGPVQCRLACAAILSAILVIGLARAGEPPNSQTSILGIGNSSCTAYLKAADADRKARPADSNNPDMFFYLDAGLYGAWVDGYLTAANSYNPDKRTSGQNTTHLARKQWLEKFCGDHPQSPFLEAVNALHESLDVLATGPTASRYVTVADQVMTVSGNAVNLRAQPSTQSEVIATLTKRTKVTVVGFSGYWTHVKYKNLDGYISTQFLM